MGLYAQQQSWYSMYLDAKGTWEFLVPGDVPGDQSLRDRKERVEDLFRELLEATTVTFVEHPDYDGPD